MSISRDVENQIFILCISTKSTQPYGEGFLIKLQSFCCLVNGIPIMKDMQCVLTGVRNASATNRALAFNYKQVSNL